MFQGIFISLAFLSLGSAQDESGVIEDPNTMYQGLIVEAQQLSNETVPVQSQIVGGVPADIENYPYQVQLLLNNGFRCGGSILSKRNILTAAHCVDGISANFLSIRVGSSFKSGGTVIPVTSYRKHPNFNRQTADYDVALITLSRFLTYGPGIGRIEISDTVPTDGTRLTVTGWGALYQGGPTATQLQVVRVPKVSFSYCARRYRLTPRMLCAGYGFQGTCNGDSGGPLTASGKQVGVVSFGAGCNRFLYPDVYASVPELATWIRYYTVAD